MSEVTINFEDEEAATEIMVYTCGLFEELAEEEIIEIGSMKKILSDEGKGIYAELLENGFNPSHKDMIIATMSVLELASRSAVQSLIFSTVSGDLGGIN